MAANRSDPGSGAISAGVPLALVLCVLGSPAAVAGIAINVAILAVIGYVALRAS